MSRLLFRRLASLAVAVVLAPSPGTAAPPTRGEPPAATRKEADRYEDCLALARGNPAEALGMAEAWREAGGGFPAQHCAAVALVEQGKYAEGARRLEALAAAMMQAAPAMRADALEQAGQAWLLDGKPAEAKAAFDAGLALAPGAPDLLIGRAQAYADGGQYRKAVADLDAALTKAPDRVDALVYRASAHRHLDRLDEALLDVDRALKLAPNTATAYLERGIIRRLAGDDDGARNDWRHVGDLAPGTAIAAAAEGNLARLGAPAE